MPTTTTRLTIPSPTGAALAARMDRPEGPLRATALFAHCFTCSKDTVAAGRIARCLNDKGIAVVRFDFTGLGSSGGDFASTDYSSNVADVVAVGHVVERELGSLDLLVGHSLGGAAVLAAASQLSSVQGVVTLGAPFGPEHVLRLLADDLPAIEADGEAEVVLAGRPFVVRREFVTDICHQPQTERIGQLGAALLILHSPQDQVVGIEDARAIYDAARHPKSFITLDGADHMLNAPADADYAATIIAAWASRYTLTPAGAPTVATSHQTSAPVELATGVVRVTTAEGKLAQTVRAGRHVWGADEPVPLGADSGPSPYDLLLAALGTCTAMTLQLYARRKKWALQEVDVVLQHSSKHPDDCAAAADDSPVKAGVITRTVRLVGDLDDAQRLRLLEIADRCPVHRSISTGVEVRTVAAPGPSAT